MNVTLLNSSKSLDSAGKISRRKSFAVDGVSNDDAAMTAPGIPRFGSAYSIGESFLRVSSVSARPEGGMVNTTSWLVDIDYTISSGSTQQQNQNPLLLPTRWTPSIAGRDEPFDLDADGKPIINSARERFNQTYTKLVPEIALTARKWVRATNITSILRQANRYVGKVNSASWKFGLERGQALCTGGGPVSEFQESGNDIIEIYYSFSIREDGHKLRVVDEGLKVRNENYRKAVGTYQNVKDEFIPAMNENVPVTNPIKLDGKGRRLGDTTSTAGTTPTNAEIETTADAVFLKFKRYPELPFSALGL